MKPMESAIPAARERSAMANNAIQWVSVDRMKVQMSFFRDDQGRFVDTLQDTKITDAIVAAVSWCEAFTGLPLIRRVEPYFFPFENRESIEPLTCQNVVGFAGIESAWYFEDEGRSSSDYKAINPVPTEWRFLGPSSFVRKSWVIYPPGGRWPSVGQGGGVQLDVVRDIPIKPPEYDPAAGQHIIYRNNDAITAAIVLVARDIFDGYSVHDKKGAAEHLLQPFRVPSL